MEVLDKRDVQILLAAGHVLDQAAARVSTAAIEGTDAVGRLFLGRTAERLVAAEAALSSALGVLDVWVNDPNVRAARACDEVEA